MKTLFRVAVVVLCGAIPAGAQQQATDSTFELTPTGYLQLDFRGFPDWDIAPGVGRLSRDTFEVRRLRAGLDGRWKRVTFEFSVDPLDDDGVFVKDAYAQIRLSPLFRVRAGQFKAPGTRDYAVSARALDFLERAPLTALGVGRDLGVRIDGGRGWFRYDAGVFAGDGVGRDDRSGLLVASRIVAEAGNDLELGFSISQALTESEDRDPENGPDFRATSGFRFADGVYVNGTRLRIGADVEWSPGPWRFTAEALRLRDGRDEQGLDLEDLPAATGTGVSFSVIRDLRRRLDAGVRYDFVGIDDAGSGSGSDSVRPRATNIRARAAHTVTLGSSWRLHDLVRLLGNAGLERYTDTRSAPEAGRAGNYYTLGARLQLEWR